MRARIAQTLNPPAIELFAELLRKSIDFISKLVIQSSVAASPCILSLTNKSSELICNPGLVS